MFYSLNWCIILTVIHLFCLGGMCPFRHISGEKTVVCKHWLRGLCKKGDQCEFLHEYDMTKMPECYFYSKFGSFTCVFWLVASFSDLSATNLLPCLMLMRACFIPQGSVATRNAPSCTLIQSQRSKTVLGMIEDSVNTVRSSSSMSSFLWNEMMHWQNIYPCLWQIYIRFDVFDL